MDQVLVSTDGQRPGTLQRRQSSPVINRKPDAQTKKLKKRNSVPVNLATTLDMLGRLHDTHIDADKVVKDWKNSGIVINADKYEDTSKSVHQVDMTGENRANIHSKGKLKKLPSQITIQLNDTTIDKVRNMNKKANTVPTAYDESLENEPNGPVNLTKFPTTVRENNLNDMKLISGDTYKVFESGSGDTDAGTSTERESRDIQNLNQNRPFNDTFDANVGANVVETDEDSIDGPCRINIASCSSVTMSTDFGEELPHDVNYLYVADRENNSPKHCINDLPNIERVSGSPVRDTNNRRASRNLDGCVSTENLSGDESLHEARTRMHKLLDDAFSLISPRASFTENNFPRPTESQGGIYINKDDGLPTGNQSHQHIDGHRGRDVKHEPMYVNPFYSESTFPLETWSPYRTSDLVAMISMPSQQETTKLGQKPKSATRPSSSKPNRRPAANFDFNETKSASTFEEDRFTTSPAKPIVIRSRDSTENTPSNNNRQSNNRLSSGRATVMVSPLPKTTQNEQYEMNSIPKGSSRNGSAGRNKSRSIDRSNVDEVDVINDLDVGQNSDKLIKSLRDELGELKELYSVPNTRVQRKKNKKNTQDSNTEAV